MRGTFAASATREKKNSQSDLGALLEQYRERAAQSIANTTSRTTLPPEPRESWRRNLGDNQRDIANWFDEGKERGATHMVVMSDTYDYTNYPIFVYPNENVRDKAVDNPEEMQRVREIYRLDMDLRTQIETRRAMNV